MQKTKFNRIAAALGKHGTVSVAITIIYTLVLLLKFFYFSSQIGDGRIGLLPSIATLGSLLMLTTISLVLKPKPKLWYLNVLNIILIMIIFSNVMFYRYFRDLISIPLITQASVVGDIGGSMVQLLHYSDLLLVADFIFLPIAIKAIRRKVRGEDSKLGAFRTALAFWALGVTMVFLSFSQLIKSQPTILQTFYDRVYVAQNIGVLNYHGADAYAFVKQSLDERNVLDYNKSQEIYEYFNIKNQNNTGSEKLFGAGKGKNLVVIQLEAVQQFVINNSVNGREITPNLNKLIASGIYFDNYYYQTAGGGTSDAEFTANVSMFPMKEGAVYIRKPGNDYYSLPIRLKEEGYSTLAMHGYKPGFWNRSVIYKNLGFDEFYSKDNMAQNELLGMGISDKDFFMQAAEKLKTQKQPFHAFLITLSSHFPYDNDKSKYSSFDVGEYKGTLLGDYLEAMHYTDEALGEFVEALQSNGMMDDTILAIYGDHHGIPKDNEKDLAKFLGKESLSTMDWQLLQKVPMIIKVPGADHKIESIVGGGVDFMPTILNLMGFKADSQPSLGRDLLNSKEGLAILRNGSFVTKDMVFISNENICYDRMTGKELEISQYAETKLEVERLLNYSDTIINFDLVNEIKAYLDK